MHVQLKLTLACSPAAAIDALANPEVMVAVTRPLVKYRSLSRFPRRWSSEPHLVSASILGVFPLGRTHVDLSWRTVQGARIQEDTGTGVAGTFRTLSIRHRMAVSPAPLPSGLPRGTLLRDRLEFDAGLLGPLLWPGLWLVWQWRGYRMRRLAPTWTTPASA